MRYAQVSAKHDHGNVIHGAVYFGVSDPAEAISMFLEEFHEYMSAEWTIWATIYD